MFKKEAVIMIVFTLSIIAIGIIVAIVIPMVKD